MKKIGLVGLVAAAAVLATGGNAYAADSGVGWKLESGSPYWIDSVRHDSTYTLTFVTKTARQRLTPYLRIPVAQLNAMPEVKAAGVRFVVSTTVEGGTNLKNKKYCKGRRNHIMFTLAHRPLNGQKGMSQAKPCYNTTDNSAWGGYTLMDTEYWSSAGEENGWFSPDKAKNTAMTRNAVTHELGHMIGLDHPDPAKFDPEETKPVMTSPNGGYLNSNGGTFTTADKRGITRLVANGD